MFDAIKEKIDILIRFRHTLLYFAKRFLRALSDAIILTTAPFLKWVVFESFAYYDLIIFAPVAVVIVVMLFAFVRMLIPFFYIHKVHEHESEVIEKGRAGCYEGEPETGKTLSMTNDSLILADYSYSEMLFKVLLQEGKESIPTLPPFNNPDEERQFRAVKESVDYFMANPDKIPCLASSYGIERNGQYSSRLLKRHFLQESRLPEGTVTALDESADILSNKRSKATGLTEEEKEKIRAENDTIDDLVSKERHYGDFRMLFAEQDSGENYIGIRRVISSNRYLTDLEKVCEPINYIKKYARLKRKTLKKMKCSVKRYKKITKLAEKIKLIGFIKISYEDRGNSQKSKSVVDTGYYVIPKDTGFKYATRAYQFQYKALDKEVKLSTHNGLFLKSKNVNNWNYNKKP